jgi:hypothetical protein
LGLRKWLQVDDLDWFNSNVSSNSRLDDQALAILQKEADGDRLGMTKSQQTANVTKLKALAERTLKEGSTLGFLTLS